MKVFYSAQDHSRLISGDETVKLYAEASHTDLKGTPTRSTSFIGDAKRVIQGKGTTPKPSDITDAPPTSPTVEVSAEIAEDSASEAPTPEPELTPAQKAAATRAANKAKAEAAAAKREAAKAKKA